MTALSFDLFSARLEQKYKTFYFSRIEKWQVIFMIKVIIKL